MARSSNSRPQAEGWVRRSTRTTKKPERLGQARQHEQPGSYYPRADVVRACIEHGIELQIMNLGDFGPVYPLPRDRNPNIGVYGPFWLPPIDVPDTTTPQITIGSSPAPLTSQNLLSLASDTPQHEADLPSTDQRAESSKDTFVLSSDSELTPVPEPSPPRETSDDKPEGRSPQAALAEGSGAKTSRTVTATATFPKGFLRRYTVLLNDLAEEIEGLRQNNRLSEELDDEDLEEWCICRMGDIDENGSVKCDNPNCSVGWYHQGCLNHRDRILHQKYELWLCTICLNGRLKALHAEEEEAGNNEIEQAEPCFDNYPDDPFVLSASSDLRDTDEIPPNSLEVEARQEASWNNDEYEARGSQAQSLQSLIPTSPSLHGPGIEAPILHTTSLQPPMPAIASNAPPTPLETQWSTATSTQQSTTASIRQSSVYVPHPSKISLSVMNALGLSLSAKRWTSPASTVVKEPDQDSMHVKYKHNMNLPE